MPKILEEIGSFLTSKAAQAIHPLPAAMLSQRGPTCGFSALAYVLTYWHMRFELRGGSYRTTAPLPARTNLLEPRQGPSTTAAKAEQAGHGVFTSLRQYGKFFRLTVLGSVFNAENIVKVAKGEHSQYAGQFDGRVVPLEAPERFSVVVKAMLDWECPVIVPYDVSVADATAGEPTNAGGEAAHWVTIIAYFTDASVDYAVFFNWGAFYFARMDQFGVSNAQLSSNEHRPMAKYTITNGAKKVLFSDYCTEEFANSWKSYYEGTHAGVVLSSGTVMHNPEFNNTGPDGKLDDKDGRNRLEVGSLRGNVVVIFRKEDEADIAGVLARI